MVSSFSYPVEEELLISEFEKLAQRENKSKSELLIRADKNPCQGPRCGKPELYIGYNFQGLSHAL